MSLLLATIAPVLFATAAAVAAAIILPGLGTAIEVLWP
jgi:hypothetical protein